MFRYSLCLLLGVCFAGGMLLSTPSTAYGNDWESRWNDHEDHWRRHGNWRRDYYRPYYRNYYGHSPYRQYDGRYRSYRPNYGYRYYDYDRYPYYQRRRHGGSINVGPLRFYWR